VAAVTYSRQGPIAFGPEAGGGVPGQRMSVLHAGVTPTFGRPVSAQEVLRATLRHAWDSDPTLQGMRGSLQGVGRRISPSYRAVAERTGFGVELKREALKAGVSDLMRTAWSPPLF
jgi:hypothetical protein